MIGEFVAEHSEHRFVLAGGLNPGNVAEAIRAVRPAAVDVAGGVEESPGKKDPAKVRDFIQAVRSAA
jgi:phosphoribosylanthranilate isomerase